MIEYIKSHEEHAVTPLTISPNHNAWPSKILKKLLDGHQVGEQTFCIHKDEGLEFYADYHAWDRGSDHFLEKLKKDKSIVKEVSINSSKIADQIIKKIRSFERENIQKWPHTKIAKFLSHTYKLGNDLCAYGFVPVISDHFFHKFTHLLKAIIKEKNVSITMAEPEMIFLLCSHNKFVPSKLARIELLKLIKSFNNKVKPQDVHEKISDYYQDWYWTDFGQLGPGVALSDILLGASNLSKDKSLVHKELKELKDSAKILQKKQKELIDKLGLTAQERFLFSTAREFTYLKGLRMEVLFGLCAAWSKVIEEASARLEINKKILYYASVDELVAALSGQQSLNKEILKERSKFCVWVADTENTQKILAGKEAKEFLKTLKFKEDKKIDKVLVIHGTVASMGYAKGKVKIVNKVSEINKIEEGDILVSVATHPGLLPAMKKASAFVTDAGGITSHAAIVAREMGKPCIIGTKIATRVLKDGDLIEADTKKGNIKKI